jgi:hypothetical protein
VRPLVILALAPVLALGLAVSAGVFVPDDPSNSSLKPQSIVWDGRVFTSKAQFARWLETRHESYAVWVKRHPSATWFHKEEPVVPAKPPKPASVKAAEVDRDFARIFIAAALGLGVLFLVAMLIRSGPVSMPSGLRIRRRRIPPPLRPALPRALGRGPQPPPLSPANTAPHLVYPTPVSSRRGGTVVPLYVPEPDSEPAVAWPAAAFEASAVELRKPRIVAEQALAAHPEPVIEPEPFVMPLVVSLPVAAPEPVFEPEPTVELEPEPVAESAPVAAPTPEPPAAPVASPAPIAEPRPILIPPPPVEISEVEPPDVEHAAAAAAEVGVQMCEIGLWKGYRKSQFFARGVAVDGVEYAVAQSPVFRSRNPGADDEAARDAHTELAEQLLELGWQRDGAGDEWWALRFLLED